QPVAEPVRGAAHRLDPPKVPRSCRRAQRTPPAPHPNPLLRGTITGRALTFRSTRMPPTDGQLSPQNSASSSRFPKLAACISATSGARPESSRVRPSRDLLPSGRSPSHLYTVLLPWLARRTPTANCPASHHPGSDPPGVP